MKAMNTFGVQFIIRQDKLKDGKAPIYARITVNGEIIHFTVKQWIDPKFWDQRKGSGKGNKDVVKIINGGLDQIRLSLGNCYQQLLLKGQMITPCAIKDAFFGNDGEDVCYGEVDHLIPGQTDQGNVLTLGLQQVLY